jgi:ferritin-like metal-binding protein YciE
MTADLQEQLVKHLADAHAIEEQALTQLRRAPGIAEDPEIAAVFERHLGETESHEKRVLTRLESHQVDASKAKDLAGKAGGVAMVLFAKFNPDTPGKLVAHAYSYEHMELAAYELLSRIAERAEDQETAAVARDIAAEEAEMARRLEGVFDQAVTASLGNQDPADLDEQLNSYLADAHAIEKQATSLLEGAHKLLDDGPLAALFEKHLDETRSQEQRVRDRLESRGSSTSRIKDIGMRLGGFNLAGFFGAQPDTPAKLTGFAFAFEHLEIAAYEQLRRVADRAGDATTVNLADAIASEERAMADRIAAKWDIAADAALDAQDIPK